MNVVIGGVKRGAIENSFISTTSREPKGCLFPNSGGDRGPLAGTKNGGKKKKGQWKEKKYLGEKKLGGRELCVGNGKFGMEGKE